MAHKISLHNLLIIVIITITYTTYVTAWPVPPTIGVTIDHYPAYITHEGLVAIVKRYKIKAVRLIDPDPSLIRAFSNSSVSLLLAIPNTIVHSLSANQSNAMSWVVAHVTPFYPGANITSISVGSNATIDHILAIRNVYEALSEVGIKNIQVSTTFSLISILTSDSVFPPSLAQFSEQASHVVRPYMDFLRETNSCFMVSLSPYQVYRAYPEIPVGFALFEEARLNYREDHNLGRYHNLFDTMVDALQSAMKTAAYFNIPIVVAETGWPWTPGEDTGEDMDATLEYAEVYLRRLIDHLKFDIGTPLYSKVPEVYIYELFDRGTSLGQGNGSGLPSPMTRERQWGVLYPNSTIKYKKLDFNGVNSRLINYFLRVILFGVVIAIL